MESKMLADGTSVGIYYYYYVGGDKRYKAVSHTVENKSSYE
jgi:hypothetical protein